MDVAIAVMARDATVASKGIAQAIAGRISRADKVLGVLHIRPSSLVPFCWNTQTFPLLTRGRGPCHHNGTLRLSLCWDAPFARLGRQYLRPPLPVRYYTHPWTPKEANMYGQFTKECVMLCLSRQQPAIHTNASGALLAQDFSKFERAIVKAHFARIGAAMEVDRAGPSAGGGGASLWRPKWPGGRKGSALRGRNSCRKCVGAACAVFGGGGGAVRVGRGGGFVSRKAPVAMSLKSFLFRLLLLAALCLAALRAQQHRYPSARAGCVWVWGANHNGQGKGTVSRTCWDLVEETLGHCARSDGRCNDRPMAVRDTSGLHLFLCCQLRADMFAAAVGCQRVSPDKGPWVHRKERTLCQGVWVGGSGVPHPTTRTPWAQPELGGFVGGALFSRQLCWTYPTWPQSPPPIPSQARRPLRHCVFGDLSTPVTSDPIPNSLKPRTGHTTWLKTRCRVRNPPLFVVAQPFSKLIQMRKRVLLAHFELVVARFGPPKIQEC